MSPLLYYKRKKKKKSITYEKCPSYKVERIQLSALWKLNIDWARQSSIYSGIHFIKDVSAESKSSCLLVLRMIQATLPENGLKTYLMDDIL